MASTQGLAIGELGSISSVLSSSGKWYSKARFRGANGRVVQLRGSGDTQRKAERALRAKAASHLDRNGDALISPDSTVRQLVAFWLEEERAGDRIAIQTLEKYESEVTKWVLPRIGDLKLRELTVGRADAFIKTLRQDKGLPAARRIKANMSSICGLAVRHDALSSNVIRDTARLPKPKQDVRALTRPDVNAIRRALATYRTGDGINGPKPDGQLSQIIETILGTSARPAEVLALRRQDILDSATAVLIAATLVETKHHGLIRQPHTKRERQHRVVSVPEFTAEVLRERLAATDGQPDDAYLFQTRKGTPHWPSNIQRRWREFRQANPDLGIADFDSITQYSFRKTVATVLTNAGGVALAAELLAHSSESTTLNHYVMRPGAVNPVTAEILERELGLE